MEPVVDMPLALLGQGTLSGTGSAQQVTGSLKGEGYLTISVDPGASGPVYVGGSGVTGSTNGFPLWPGQARTARYKDVSTIYVVAPASAAVGWIAERE